MNPLVECVPNFSEGRDRSVIDQIAAAVVSVSGIKLLDVDMGADTNRTVVTFVGPPEPVAEAAFLAIQKAAELIDMRQHRGAHARMGATDVCPFVPISSVSMEKCVALARELGRRVGQELLIPVYLYEYAASRPERKNLADIRSGEYEALSEKLVRPEWKPDFGPASFHARSGATVIGARDFLIAYNVNLNTRDAALAKRIAARVREQGRSVRRKDGSVYQEAGTLPAVKATGWYIAQYGQAQVTMNLVNFYQTSVHEAFEEVCRVAQELGLRVTGSEIVGLVPREALIEAGKFYVRRQGKSSGVPDKELIHMADKSLGLSDVSPFESEKKVIEEAYGESAHLLVRKSVRDFTDELSTENPVPGGGSVAAFAAAQAAALIAMVANVTHGKKGYESVEDSMMETAERAQWLKSEFLKAVDDDSEAFSAVMSAFRLPKGTDREKEKRNAAIEAATLHASDVPYQVAHRLLDLLPLAETVVRQGNRNAVSDAGTAVAMCRAAAEGALLNVAVNLKALKDPQKGKLREEDARLLRERIMRSCDELANTVVKAIGAGLD